MSFEQLSLSQIINIGLFGFVFGFFETITNTYYLLTDNLKLSRLQHGRELPRQVNDRTVRHKVVQMLILGLLLQVIAVISIFITPQLFIVAIALIFLNGLIDYGKFRQKETLLLWSVISLIALMLLLY